MPTKRLLKSSDRPSEMLCSGMPEVLVEMMASSFAVSSTRCMSSLLGSSFSIMASTIQSASPTRSKSLLEVAGPDPVSHVLAHERRRPGVLASSRSPPLRRRRLSSSSGAMSSRSTSSPALAQWAAMAAPIVPAPSTATFLILCDINASRSYP